MSTQAGIGVMLSNLAGNRDSVEAFTKAIGKTIAEVRLGTDDALHFTMGDGYKFKLFDDGQSCCESRYMRTDDDLAHYVGATLLGAETRQAPSPPETRDDDCHDVQFLAVQTSTGEFVMSSHNEHNGYYGGFAIRAAGEE